MNHWLTKLGIQPDVRALFGISGNNGFDYGDTAEEFGPGVMKVPASRNIWCCGNRLAAEWIVTWSAAEAMAMLTCQRNAFQDHQNLCILALGCSVSQKRIRWIARHYQRRKITLVFANDLTGRAADILIAAGLKNRSVTFVWQNTGFAIKSNNREFFIENNRLSLAAFEKAAGIRSHARTIKPRHCNTFLEQLYDETR